MAWLAKDKDGTEAFYAKKPLRELEMWVERPVNSNRVNHTENLPKGTIFRLIGRELDWEDEPVELTEETLVKPVTDEEIEEANPYKNASAQCDTITYGEMLG